jgi:hypothetical protein
MFRGIKGRRVIVNCSTGEAFRGVVISARWRVVRLSGVDVIDGGTEGSAEGVARIPRSIVTWIQEL